MLSVCVSTVLLHRHLKPNSFFALEYPRERFDVFVIADNCTDRTAEVGRQEGAIVLERTNNELRGKGYALRWCMDQLLSRPDGYDAFVVVDADRRLEFRNDATGICTIQLCPPVRSSCYWVLCRAPGQRYVLYH